MYGIHKITTMAGEETFKEQQKNRSCYIINWLNMKHFNRKLNLRDPKIFYNILIEGFVLPGCDVISLGISFPKFRRNASSSSWRLKLHENLQFRRSCSSEKSRTTYPWTEKSGKPTINLQAPCVLYIGQAFRYSPENAFCMFNQQIYFIIWYLLRCASFM